MSLRSSRRDFLRTATYTGIGIWVADSAKAAGYQTPNEKINFACVGVGGKGDSNSADASRFGNIVAICDIDDNTLDHASQRYPNAKRYNDYRKMIDEMHGQIDAVTVSIPDHNHAQATALALMAGKAVYCQKPMTHYIYEARKIGELAKKMKVPTQMGNQGTAQSGLRRHAAQIRAGAVGVVKEVHVWTNRPIWPQGQERPAPTEVPPNVHWDLWLGPAAERPYAPGYHPFAWRGFWDFGTGALGDMACHTVNMPYMALDLRYPTSVWAESSGTNKDSYPKKSRIKYEFPANKERGPVTMWWYDGGNLPPKDVLQDIEPSDSGSLVVGDKGRYYAPGDYGGNGHLYGGTEIDDVKFEVSPGHFEELARAIKGGPAPVSNFHDYSGPLTETILLGNLAVWADGKTIEWDAKHLRAKNAPEVEMIIKPTYRSGYNKL